VTRTTGGSAGEDQTLDDLVGDWRIYQLRKGHRFSTDDMLTAWVASREAPQALHLLDLGSGIGSVGLMTLWHMRPEARLRCVEVQEVSHGLASRTVELNGIVDRVDLFHGDLRDEKGVPALRNHDLVTGSPPYFPLGTGVVSSHPQRAGARMELKGDVFDYCLAAERSLSEDGLFVFCHAAGDDRPEEAIAAAGLVLRARQEVEFREGQPPTIALFVCGRDGTRRDRDRVVVRGEDGQWTEPYMAIRREMGCIPPATGRSFG
jgi:tRNA1(Val) A37 N6-methylase TrmN6